MAFINNSSIINNGSAATNNSKKESGEFFLKVGYPAMIPDSDQETVVSLPFDTDLENMPELKISASEGWVNQLNVARNQLRKDILESVQKLEPGEYTEINLKVFVYRRSSKEVKQMSKENPFARKMDL